MIPAPFDYVLAESVADAVRLLREHGEEAKALAGGMSLIPLMKMRLAQPAVLVDLAGIPGLRGARVEEGRLHVGALTRHVDLARDPVVRRHLPLLARMAGGVGDTQVRSRGTIGGVLGHADSAGDYCVLAAMMGAEIVTDRAVHRVEDFLVDFMTTSLAPDEVVTEVRFPVADGPHDYATFRRRRTDWATVGVAVQQTSSGWRVGVSNVASTVLRVPAAEQALDAGGTADEVAGLLAEGLAPVGDDAAPAEYKRHLARVLTVQALGTAGRR